MDIIYYNIPLIIKYINIIILKMNKAIWITLLVVIVVIIIVAMTVRYCMATVITFYYTNGCPHSQKMWPVWNKVKESCVNQMNYIIFKEHDLNNKPVHSIQVVPTFTKKQGRNKPITKTGSMSYEELMSFIQN